MKILDWRKGTLYTTLAVVSYVTIKLVQNGIQYDNEAEKAILLPKNWVRKTTSDRGFVNCRGDGWEGYGKNDLFSWGYEWKGDQVWVARNVGAGDNFSEYVKGSDVQAGDNARSPSNPHA